MKKLIILFIIVVILPISYCHGDLTDSIGTNWLRESKEFKFAIATGYKIGYENGAYDALSIITNKLDLYKKKMLEEKSDTIDAFINMINNDFTDTSKNDSKKPSIVKLTSRVSADQLIEGLDVFYKDFRNRDISLGSAFSLVVLKINGSPQEKIDKAIEALRKIVN